ncbi:MAG: maleylacetoacetate isomerase, partial [Deltaproteobacteria bacterium]
MKSTLYGYWRSSSAWRVRIALNFKDVPYEYVAVHLLEDGGQQHGEEFRVKNPMRQVPLLEIR